MYELIALSEHDYYIDCPAKIGLVRIGEQDVIAIDSGSDKDAGKKVLRHIEANGWHLTAILNTHSHADHIGGNKLLQDRTGCKIYAPGLEAEYTNRPELEAMTLYGGLPFRDLKNKFLLAQPSHAEPLTPECLPDGWEIIKLPGHCFSMVGFRTPDGNVFLGDCLSSEETLAKYGIGYLWDPAAYIATLERVKEMEAVQFIPSHAPASASVALLAQKNIESVEKLLSCLTEICGTGACFEDILARVFTAYGLTMNAQQYALIGSTVRSCLSSLHGAGKLTFRFEDNRMLWQAV